MGDMIRKASYYYTTASDKPGEGARLLGVSLSQLVRSNASAQLPLLEPQAAGVETERDRVIARVMDEVREKFGDDKLARGRALEQ